MYVCAGCALDLTALIITLTITIRDFTGLLIFLLERTSELYKLKG